MRRVFTATQPDQLWVADITYVPAWEGWLFLAVVIDAFSRRCVGRSMSDDLQAEIVVDALGMAVTRRRPAAGVVHHSDSEYVVAGSFGWSDPHSDRREKMRKDQLPPVA